MNRIYLTALFAVFFMVSCQKETSQVVKNQPTTANSFAAANVSDGIGWSVPEGLVSASSKSARLSNAVTYCSGINTVTLYAGQNIPMGTLEYANDATNLYVSYNANPDWYFTELHLYAGLLALTPTSGGGTPTPGKFPYKRTFSGSSLSQEENFIIPLSSLAGSDFIIAAHASAIRVEGTDVVAKETAWADGMRFTSKKSWATYVSASITPCDGGDGDGMIE